MSTSPCRYCIHRAESKNKRRCVECERRIAFVIDMESEPIICGQDPVYAAAYFLPRSFGRQIGPVSSWSYADLIPT